MNPLLRHVARLVFAHDALAIARDICHACPVLDECRAYWIDHVTADDVRSGAIVAGVSARTIKRWRTMRQAVAS